jgi:hypothetical protein
MRYVQYLGPYDTIDMSPVTGKADSIFHAPGNFAVPPDLRGNLVQVTNEAWEELQTYPNHDFVEVPDDVAKPLKARQDTARANREGLEKLRAEHEAKFAVLAPVLEEEVPVVPAAPPREIAPSAVRAPADVKSEVAQETKALSTQKSGTTNASQT